MTSKPFLKNLSVSQSSNAAQLVKPLARRASCPALMSEVSQIVLSIYYGREIGVSPQFCTADQWI